MCAQQNVPQIELEVSEAGFLNESPQISKDHCFDESSHCIKDRIPEDPQKVYAECVKSDHNVRKEESNAILNSNAQKAPKKRMEDSWYLDDHLMGLEQNCLISKQPKTPFSEFEPQLVQAEKTEPWWHIIDKDELASMVTQKSVDRVENCDLPQPLTKDFRKGQLPSQESSGYCETLPSSLDWTIKKGFSDLSNHHWGRSISVNCRSKPMHVR
ncbi:uncharacterized protein LOC110412625 [Herrania umbratica]|uniref:Uncharacterized protein LOC110412625 n=1 Tax=Herrania umbratica TaxID=108875 RepID=A0A6J0ZW17_9ROSI|nr:uncharacterized protein LOC110412625 [Herrania umbratica]